METAAAPTSLTVRRDSGSIDAEVKPLRPSTHVYSGSGPSAPKSALALNSRTTLPARVWEITRVREPSLRAR